MRRFELFALSILQQRLVGFVSKKELDQKKAKTLFFLPSIHHKVHIQPVLEFNVKSFLDLFQYNRRVVDFFQKHIHHENSHVVIWRA